MIYEFAGHAPVLGAGALVVPEATVIGRVELGACSSVWFGAVIRGDVEAIRIGAESNLQDRVVVHVATDRWPTLVGCEVTVGHAAVLHGCTVGDRCLVGIGAILMDGSELGEESILAAGALVTPGMKLPPGHLHLGSPARTVRPLRAEERTHLRESAARYVRLAQRYRDGGFKVLPAVPSPIR